MRVIDNVPYEERFQAIDNAYSYLHKKQSIKTDANQTNILLCVVVGFIAGMLLSLSYFMLIEFLTT